MRRRPRQISLKECYQILGLEKGADLEAVKRAYRRRAFELHPDLNPGNPQASQDFQTLNEAYVALTGMLKPAEEARRRAEAQKGQGAQASSQKTAEPGPQAQKPQDENAKRAYAEQDVLRDLLNDPFARRVFEDIYSELNRQQTTQSAQPGPQAARQPQPEPKPQAPQAEKKQPKIERHGVPKPLPPLNRASEKGVTGVVVDWLRKQIDEEQKLFLPAHGLAPGRKIRLKVRRGMSDDVSAVEVTLPPDFEVGKPFRLRGLGKRVGPWQGDLYLTINTR